MFHTIQTKTIASIILIGVSLMIALTGRLPYTNFFFLIILSLGLFAVSKLKFDNPLIPISIWLVTFIVGFFVATYRPDGFSYPLVWSTEQLYPNGSDFKLYANLAKGLCGYLIIIWLLDSYNKSGQLQAPLSAALSLLGALLLIGVGTGIFGLETQFKLPVETLYFIVINLGITVVAEEAYFRFLLQAQIERLFKNSLAGRIIAVAIATAGFAFAHTGGLNEAFLLFSIAGFIYAVVFTLTRRFSAAVLCHFAVNLIHFIFFEYPLSLG